MSDRETEKGSTDPLGMKRTSKHKKKLAIRAAYYCCLADRPVAKERDALVGGVNAEYLAHGREVAEGEERKGGLLL